MHNVINHGNLHSVQSSKFVNDTKMKERNLIKTKITKQDALAQRHPSVGNKLNLVVLFLIEQDSN